MPRNPIWRAIAETLEAEISAGLYRAGERLPTEQVLSRRFGVNRHTVRRALGDLGARGITLSRRGAGVFVTAPAVEYPLGRRVRFHQNLAAAGMAATREILRLETRFTDAAEALMLKLRATGKVHVCEGVSLADGVPVATFISVFPAARFPDLPAHLARTGSVTEAFALSGLPDYTRAETRVTARAATALQALHLRIDEHAPILHSVSLNTDPAGQPVEYGQAWWAGERVTLTLAGNDLREA